jgi:hypothetical protein
MPYLRRDYRPVGSRDAKPLRSRKRTRCTHLLRKERRLDLKGKQVHRETVLLPVIDGHEFRGHPVEPEDRTPKPLYIRQMLPGIYQKCTLCFQIFCDFQLVP